MDFVTRDETEEDLKLYEEIVAGSQTNTKLKVKNRNFSWEKNENYQAKYHDIQY